MTNLDICSPRSYPNSVNMEWIWIVRLGRCSGQMPKVFCLIFEQWQKLWEIGSCQEDVYIIIPSQVSENIRNETTMVLGNFRTTFDADDDLSHVRNGRKELRFIQEFFYNSGIQTTEWEKTVSMKKFAKIHQQIPWKFKKESFTRKGNDLFWRIERKNGRIYSSWICVCTRYVEQPLAL